MTPYALVVEDDPMVAELFQRALQDAGFQTEILENGHKAQAHLMFTTPDLILLDLYLPSLSGQVILRQIGGQQRLGITHVVVVTGDKTAIESYAGLVDQVLVKPVGYEQLRKLAQHYLAMSV